MAFGDLMGNDPIKQLLQKMVDSNNVLHSYLFVGQSGIGKKLFAKEFAKMILCKEEEKPCNGCKSCQEFDSSNHPDFLQVEPEGSIKIEQIRKIQSKVIEKPILAQRKIYLIDEADTMTKEAQNCLLKTLEEPPEYITILLIASNENELLPTIKSRCTKIAFQKLTNEEIKKYLEEKLMAKEISDSMLETFDGSIGRAMMLKDKQESYSQVEELVKKIEQSNVIDLWNESEVLYKNKEDIFDFLDYMNVILYRMAKTQKQKTKEYVTSIKIVEQTKKNLKANSNYDMSIDNLLLQIGEELN